MKVYELMSKLNDAPAGAEVRINVVKSLNEIELANEDEECPENNVYKIKFNVKGVRRTQDYDYGYDENDVVDLDG